MREAIGGALLIKLVMFFIAIYVCFLAIAINYSITFRVKNQIINLLEEYEGADNAMPYIEDYISNVGYYRNTWQNLSSDVGCQSGYCISAVSTPGPGNIGTKTYYKVTTYVSFDFPIIGAITQFPVTGETSVIYKAS